VRLKKLVTNYLLDRGRSYFIGSCYIIHHFVVGKLHFRPSILPAVVAQVDQKTSKQKHSVLEWYY